MSTRKKFMRHMAAGLLAILICGLGAADAKGGEMREIYFAGGCFWGVQEYFSRIPGIVSTEAGYANSLIANPDYRQVCSGITRAAEAVRVVYDPAMITLEQLIRAYFAIIDPLSVNRQGNDRGTQYRTGIYYTDSSQLPLLRLAYAEAQGRHGEPLAVELAPLENFWPAEDYHQDYLKKNPGGYCHINLDRRPGTEKRLVDSEKYPKPDAATLKQLLSPQAYEITQNAETEPAFSGEHWNRHERGIYVDAVTGEPLFASSAKFDSGTGWPSFTRPIDPASILGRLDNSHGMRRIEALSRSGLTHLGHIFSDGPQTSGGLRYCINSAALRFVPFQDMEKEGYGDLRQLFGNE